MLDGNPMKSIRRDIMMVGYILFFILVFLVEWFEFVFFCEIRILIPVCLKFLLLEDKMAY